MYHALRILLKEKIENERNELTQFKMFNTYEMNDHDLGFANGYVKGVEDMTRKVNTLLLHLDR